jgi:DNA polymerase-1
MHQRLAFDCETDGLLPELTKLHCLAITDLDTGEQMDFADQPGHRPIRVGIALLFRAKLLVGHNVIDFDIPAITKVYPDWTYVRLVRDIIVLARLMWGHIKEKDLVNRGILPKKLIGAFSLESWGYRLGILKGRV